MPYIGVEVVKPDGTYATPEEIKQLRDEGVLTPHRPLVISRGEEFEKMMRDSGHWNDPVAIREALVDGRGYSYEAFNLEQKSACEDRTVILTGRLNQLRLEVVRGIVEDGVAHIYGIGAPQCRAVVETDENGAVRIGVVRDDDFATRLQKMAWKNERDMLLGYFRDSMSDDEKDAIIDRLMSIQMELSPDLKRRFNIFCAKPTEP